MVCVIRPSTVIKELPEELLLDPCTNDVLYHEILHFRVSNETVEADNRATVEVQAALQADLTASGYVILYNNIIYLFKVGVIRIAKKTN